MIVIDLSYLDDVRYILDKNITEQERKKELKELFTKNQIKINNKNTSKAKRNFLIKQNKYILNYFN